MEKAAVGTRALCTVATLSSVFSTRRHFSDATALVVDDTCVCGHSARRSRAHRRLFDVPYSQVCDLPSLRSKPVRDDATSSVKTHWPARAHQPYRSKRKMKCCRARVVVQNVCIDCLLSVCEALRCYGHAACGVVNLCRWRGGRRESRRGISALWLCANDTSGAIVCGCWCVFDGCGRGGALRSATCASTRRACRCVAVCGALETVSSRTDYLCSSVGTEF